MVDTKILILSHNACTLTTHKLSVWKRLLTQPQINTTTSGTLIEYLHTYTWINLKPRLSNWAVFKKSFIPGQTHTTTLHAYHCLDCWKNTKYTHTFTVNIYSKHKLTPKQNGGKKHYSLCDNASCFHKLHFWYCTWVQLLLLELTLMDSQPWYLGNTSLLVIINTGTHSFWGSTMNVTLHSVVWL